MGNLSLDDIFENYDLSVFSLNSGDPQESADKFVTPKKSDDIFGKLHQLHF